MTDAIQAGIPLVLGGNVFGWTADRQASFAVLDAFVAGGGRMIDTADVYSAWVPGHKGGESEQMIGEWLKTCAVRGETRVHTKVGMLPGAGGKGLAPARIAAAADASLARLGVDRVALYYAHRDDPDTPQVEGPPATKTFLQAAIQITLADLSMSLDNVLVVAAIARDNPAVLFIGLSFSVLLMGLAANLVARLVQRYPAVAWVGLLIILYVAGKMIWEGWHDVQPFVAGFVG